MKSNRPRIFLLALAALAAAASALADDAPDDASAAMAAQQGMIDLWTAGEFDAAIAAGEELARAFPAQTRGRTAHYHIANYLENLAILEAADAAEAAKILERAKGHYEKAAAQPGQAPQAAKQARLGAEIVAEKLRDLAAIQRGEMSNLAGSERLGDFEASRAAVAFLRGRLRPDVFDAHHILFLALVHQADFADGMSERLRSAYEALGGRAPGLFKKAQSKYQPMLESAARGQVALAERALADFPHSPHALDYHAYLGTGHQYVAGALMSARDSLAARGDAAGAERAREAISQELAKAKEANAALIRLAGAMFAAKLPTALFERAFPADARTLRRHRDAALDRMQDIDRLMALFAPPAPPSPTIEPAKP